jgi:hypothetical protein
MVAILCRCLPFSSKFPHITVQPVCYDWTGVDVKKNVIVAITSDKGLCGGINSTSVKVSRALHKLTSGTLFAWLI